MISPFLIWFVAYVLPCAAAYVVAKRSPKNWEGAVSYNLIVIHIALVVSILLSQYFIYARGLVFPWNFNSPWLLAYAVSVALALAFLGRLGLWYALSALIQQLTMLSIAFILFSAFPPYLVILLIAPIYTACHRMRVKYAFLIMVVFFGWGALSIFIFSLFPNIWVLAALHTLGGGLLIRQAVLFPEGHRLTPMVG